MKLVRDRYDEIIPKDELDIVTDKRQLTYLLFMKVEEELRELAATDFEDHEEFGDVFEALFALASLKDISLTDIYKAQSLKKMNKGGFKKGLLWNGPIK
jgi:predicted house-cleaning noncanonical NTP pyrophosphatase (MazG superfamily)